MAAVDSKFIKHIKGNAFIAFEGLLDLAHKEGLDLVETELVQAPGQDNGQVAVAGAKVRTKRGTFCGLGDASPENVKAHIAIHLIRMAETRAIARALRWATNVGEASTVELADLDTAGAGEDHPTDEQIDQIDELAQHDAISEEDKGMIADALPRMTRTEAAAMIDILTAKIAAVADANGKARKPRKASTNGRKKTEAGPPPDDSPNAPASQASSPEEDEDDGPPATDKQVGLIERTVRESADVLTEKEVRHIQGLLDAKLSRAKASEVLDFLLGKSVKNPLTGSWERVSAGVIDQRRSEAKAA